MKYLYRIAVVTLLAGSTLMAVGCNQKTHKQKVNEADKRYRDARTTLLLSSAQRFFDTGDLQQCEKTVLEAMSQDPKNPNLHVLRGRIYMERTQLERAFQSFEMAIEFAQKEREELEKLAKKELPLQGRNMVATRDANYYKGIVLQRWQRYEPALESYQAAYELGQDNVFYVMSVAEMLVALDRQDDALAMLEEKVDYMGQSAGIRLAIAQLYSMKADYKTACEHYTEASLLQPEDLVILEELAHIQVAAGYLSEATYSFERLIREGDFERRDDLRRSLGNVYLRLERHDEAREIFLKLTRKNAKDSEAWIRLGEIAWAEHDYSGALLAANRVISAAPTRHEGYLLSGMVWQKRAKYDQAVRMFDRAARFAPDSAAPLILQGMSLEKAGKPAEAAAAYEEALRREPNDRRAKRLLAAVESQL